MMAARDLLELWGSHCRTRVQLTELSSFSEARNDTTGSRDIPRTRFGVDVLSQPRMVWLPNRAAFSFGLDWRRCVEITAENDSWFPEITRNIPDHKIEISRCENRRSETHLSRTRAHHQIRFRTSLSASVKRVSDPS